MRSVKYWRLLVVLTVLSVFALAQTVPNLPGFPSNFGGSSSSSGGDSFWYDGGSGTIQADVNGLKLNVASSTYATFRIEDPSGTDNGGLRFHGDATGSTAPLLQLNGNGGNNQVSINSNTTNGAALYVQGNLSSTVIQAIGGSISTNASSGTTGFKMDTAGAQFRLSSSGGNDFLQSDNTGIETPSYFEAGNYVQGATGLCTGTACAGTAFASFPAAAAGNATRILMDSTNNVPRYSTGVVWQTIAYEVTMSGFLPLGVATGGTVGIQEIRIFNPGKVVGINVFPLVAGTGGGNYEVKVVNVTTAATMCSIIVGPCTAVGNASADWSCTGAVSKNDTLRLEVDSTGCTASPAFNVTATIIGG